MEIRLDDLSSPEIIALLLEHRISAELYAPPESTHVLGIEALCKADITFWSAWQDRELLGCCAIRELDPRHGETGCDRHQQYETGRDQPLGTPAQLSRDSLSRKKSTASIAEATMIPTLFAGKKTEPSTPLPSARKMNRIEP